MDADYFLQHIHNCCLVNLEDMLQNGTVINGTKIDKPKGFVTACTVATQIMAVVASSQYGGQTISLAHLAPFVDITRQKIKKKVIEEINMVLGNTDYIGTTMSIDDMVNEITEKRVRDEVKAGVQTIQYQINTINSSNGQTPFVSVFMYLDEVEEGQLKDDLAMLIEEVITQRYQGTKNENGVFVSTSFPKLLYMLQENNIEPGTKYYYLTQLAEKCSAKRLVPDYISEKIMKQVKLDKDGVGHAFPCMGCRSFLAPYIDPETNKVKFYGRLITPIIKPTLNDVNVRKNGVGYYAC